MLKDFFSYVSDSPSKCQNYSEYYPSKLQPTYLACQETLSLSTVGIFQGYYIILKL